jgi:alpha-glucoside transport system permease protein
MGVRVSALHAAVTASTFSDSVGKLSQVITAVVVFFAALLLVFFLAGRATGRFQRPLTIAIFVGPAIVLLLIGLVIPSFRTFYLSLHGATAAKNAPYVGFKNYGFAFTDPATQSVLLNTLLWIIVAPLVATGLGLMVAIVVDRMKNQSLVKSLIFMPMAISFVGASIIWKYVYDYKQSSQPQDGLLSQVVIKLGWKHPPNWLLTHPLNNFLLMVILIWIEVGFAMVVLSAAIKSVPDEIIEAARVDGAHGFGLFSKIQIPMIRATLVVVLTTIMIATLKIFDIVQTTTGGNFGTNVLANAMYQNAFVTDNTGRGAALALILFAGVLPLVGYNVLQLKKERANR